MKGKMDRTIGICVGNSIVSFFGVSLSFARKADWDVMSAANCCVRRPASGRHWMDIRD